MTETDAMAIVVDDDADAMMRRWAGGFAILDSIRPRVLEDLPKAS
jgi:hypothetical protein